MAKIPIEKKSSGAWLWWLLGLLFLVGAIWVLAESFDADEPEYEVTEDVVVPTTPAPAEPTPVVTVANILDNPSVYVGDSFPAMEVDVAEVPTDRGFWIENGGQRLFVILNDAPVEEPKDINPGQRVYLTAGTLRTADYLPQISGEPLDQDTRAIAQEQDVFLVIDESNVEIREAGTPQPGTDPAESVQ